MALLWPSLGGASLFWTLLAKPSALKASRQSASRFGTPLHSQLTPAPSTRPQVRCSKHTVLPAQ